MTLRRRQFLSTIAGVSSLGFTGCMKARSLTGGDQIEDVTFEGNTVKVSITSSEKVDRVNLINPDGERIRSTGVAVGESVAKFPWMKLSYREFSVPPEGENEIVAVGGDGDDERVVGRATVGGASDLTVVDVVPWQELDAPEEFAKNAIGVTVRNEGDVVGLHRGITIRGSDLSGVAREIFQSTRRNDPVDAVGMLDPGYIVETYSLGPGEEETFVYSALRGSVDSCGGRSASVPFVHKRTRGETAEYELTATLDGEHEPENPDNMFDDDYYCTEVNASVESLS